MKIILEENEAREYFINKYFSICKDHIDKRIDKEFTNKHIEERIKNLLKEIKDETKKEKII